MLYAASERILMALARKYLRAPQPTTGAEIEAQPGELVLGTEAHKNVPIIMGSGSDSLEALVDGKFVVMRVPYPMGYHARGADGRIDDPRGGWKGRGLWSSYNSQAPWLVEGGKGQTSKVMKFQIRPTPLAK